MSLFIEENNQLFELAKKIRLHLYQKTKNEAYLDDVLSLHESSMYSRIRSRLNLRSDVLLSKIPQEVVTRERQLKNNLNKIVIGETTNAIDSFFEINNSWKHFIDTLKTQYPEYYKLHYATLEESVSDIQKYIDKETTVIRYFFIEENLLDEPSFDISTPEEILKEKPFSGYLRVVSRGVGVIAKEYHIVKAILENPEVRRKIPRDGKFLWGNQFETAQDNLQKRQLHLQAGNRFMGLIQQPHLR